jgi:hypothetical protein
MPNTVSNFMYDKAGQKLPFCFRFGNYGHGSLAQQEILTITNEEKLCQQTGRHLVAVLWLRIRTEEYTVGLGKPSKMLDKTQQYAHEGYTDKAMWYLEKILLYTDHSKMKVDDFAAIFNTCIKIGSKATDFARQTVLLVKRELLLQDPTIQFKRLSPAIIKTCTSMGFEQLKDSIIELLTELPFSSLGHKFVMYCYNKAVEAGDTGMEKLIFKQFIGDMSKIPSQLYTRILKLIISEQSLFKYAKRVASRMHKLEDPLHLLTFLFDVQKSFKQTSISCSDFDEETGIRMVGDYKIEAKDVSSWM